MEIDRLEIAIQSEATRASAELDKVINKLNILSGALGSINTGSFKNMASGIDVFAVAVQNAANVKTSDFSRLSRNIDKIANINQSGIRDTAGSLKELTNTFNEIGSVSDEAMKLAELAKNIGKLGSINIQRATENLPRLSAALKEFMTTLSTAPNVSDNVLNMTNAMANLASYGSKYGATINSMARASSALTKGNSDVVKSTRYMRHSLTSEFSRLVASFYTVKQAIDFIGKSIKNSMDFTETVNLFQTSFKKIGMDAARSAGLEWGSEAANQYAIKFIDRAQSFNDKISKALSLDPNTMANYQAVFAQISNSMGLTTETAMNMSESLTLLGNDIASLWNLETKNAMEKLQSGIVGQVKPLRELGIDISQTSLKLTAYRYGITDSISKMSQAAKTQLRWLTIMDQAEVAFGDMAKTIDNNEELLLVA